MTLDQIGQKLKSAREVSGLSLAQIQEKTKIPYNHLASIDAGNFDDLPEPVYVSGFIKRFAECVGLDAQELVDEYRSEVDTSSAQPEKTGLLFKNRRNNDNNMAAQANYYNRQRLEKSAPNLFKLVPFYTLWIVLILILIVYLVNRQGEMEQNQQDASLLTLKQAASTVVPTTTTSPEPDNSLSKDLYKVTVKANNHVWVEVKAISNGEALFNGFLEAGDKHDFSDKEGLRITAINGSIAVSASGKTSEFGVAGKTTEKVFSSNNVSQVVESPAKESTGEASSTSTQSASLSKKPIGETAITKKPIVPVTSTPKTHSFKESAHEFVPNNESDNQGQGNKAIDVPYRYSE